MEGGKGDLTREALYERMVSEFGIDVAKKVSSDDRFDQLGETDFDMTPFVYGEITFAPIAEILDDLNNKGLIKDQSIFYDLGSGFGKPCLAAALTLPSKFKKCIGIEYLDGLFQKSLELKSVYDAYRSENSSYPNIIFEKDDFIANTSWSLQADVIFANATCFENHMVSSISKTLNDKLKPGSIVIITTKLLECQIGTDFKLIVEQFKKEMSWGQATVNIY